MTALEFASVSLRSRDSVDLDSLDLTVRIGDVVAIVGRAGSGKSAVLDAILGRATTTSGRIRVGDLLVTDRSRAVQRQVTWVARSGVLESHLTVRQNVNLILEMSEAPSHDRDAVTRALRMSDVPDRVFDARAAVLTTLEGLAVWFAVARLRQTPVILLDDPTSLLSPSEASRIGVRIRELSAEGTAVLVVTRDGGFAEEVADIIHILEAGHLSPGRPSRLRGLEGRTFAPETLMRSL